MQMRNVYADSMSLLYISASNKNAKKYVFEFVDSMYGYELRIWLHLISIVHFRHFTNYK